VSARIRIRGNVDRHPDYRWETLTAEVLFRTGSTKCKGSLRVWFCSHL